MANVYAIRDGRALKFGMADDVRTRVSTLQTGNASALVLIAVIPGKDGWPRGAIQQTERMIHEYLADERLRGEWFAGPKTEDLAEKLTLFDPEMVLHDVILRVGSDRPHLWKSGEWHCGLGQVIESGPTRALAFERFQAAWDAENGVGRCYSPAPRIGDAKEPRASRRAQFRTAEKMAAKKVGG